MRAALRRPRYPLSELARSLQILRSGRDSLFDLIYYRPVGTGAEQDATYAYFAANRPTHSKHLRLWELVDIDAVIAEYNRDMPVEA